MSKLQTRELNYGWWFLHRLQLVKGHSVILHSEVDSVA